MARGRFPKLGLGSLAVVMALSGAQPLFALPDRDRKQEREEDEALLQKLIEIVEKTAEQAEDEELDKTPYAALEPKDQEAAAEIVRRLDNQRVSLNFDDTTFNEALDFLRDWTGINIVLTRAAKDLVENAGKMRLKLKDVKVRNALELILTQTDKQLRYGFRHGVLEIGVVEDWKGKNMIVEIIPVDELLYRPPDFPAPEAGLEMIKPKWKR